MDEVVEVMDVGDDGPDAHRYQHAKEEEMMEVADDTDRASPADRPPPPEKPAGTHSMWSAVANFVNSIVGAGIIGLPFSYERGGFWVATVLLVLIGILTAYSVKLIVRLGEAIGAPDYEILCERLLGRTGYYTVSYSMIFFAYGAMLTYLIIIGDTMAPVLGDWFDSAFFGNRTVMILLCACLICLPLSSFRDIGKLGKTSGISIVCVIVLTFAVCIRAFGARAELDAVSGAWTDERLARLGVGFSSRGSMDEAQVIVAQAQCHKFYATGPDSVPDGAWTMPAVDEAATPYTFVSYTVNAGGQLLLTIEVALAALKAAAGEKAELVYSVAPDSNLCGDGAVQRDLLTRTVKLEEFNIMALEDGEGKEALAHPAAEISWSKSGEKTGEGVVTLTVAAPQLGEATRSAFAFAHSSFFPALGVISFAYVCHHSSFLVRNSLRNPDDWDKVCNISIGIATVLSIMMAAFGYGNFQRCTRPDVLNNFMNTDIAANLARLLLACTMFFTYPMEFFVVRQALTTLAFNGDASGHRHWLLTGVIFLVTVPPGLSLSSDQLGLVLEFTGGICASLLGFVLPGLCWFAYRRRYGEVPQLGEARDSPHAAGSGAGTARIPYGDIFKSRTVAPAAVLVGLGSFSLAFNLVLGCLHAAGVDTYEYPEYCPETGVE
eukprot:TRINITY_DN10024_c0_g1_i1.p1 TRINITY_DN10024_c0_g1~~TRINITY_DN10024_c0_g1_i1.p1  ORF type:complete len:662 (+),score=206.36 TRINITY_DN10024_c0_g1_i1:51-2036(+)